MARQNFIMSLDQQNHPVQMQQEESQDPLNWWNSSSGPEMPDDPNVTYALGLDRKTMEDNFFRDFARDFHRQDFSSLDQYEKWVKSRPSAFQEIDGFIKKTATEYMPRKVKEQYESMMVQRQAEDQFRRTLDLHGQMASKIKDAVDAGDLPEGVFFDPRTNGLNYKAPKKQDPAKIRAQLIGEIGKYRQFKRQASEDGADEEAEYYQTEIDRLIGELKGEGVTDLRQEGPTQEDVEALQFMINNPNDPESIAGMKVLGFQNIEQVQQMHDAIVSKMQQQ